MLRCPECGSMVQDGSDFCPHCGRLMSDADHVTEEEFARYTAPRRSYLPLLMMIVTGMLLLPMLFGFFAPHGDDQPDLGPMERTVTWDFMDYKKSGTTEGPAIGTFELTYTVDEDELRLANSSPISRTGTQLRFNDAAGNIAVKDFVVVGKTVSDVSYKLCSMFSEFVSSHSGYNTPVYFADFISCFVQAAVDYVLDSEQHGANEYWCYPVETLYLLKGDCEDSSILLDAIYCAMASIENTDGAWCFEPSEYILDSCCFGLPGHFMTGVKISDVPVRDNVIGKLPVRSMTEEGSVYYFLETTGSPDKMHTIGWVSSGLMHSDAEFYDGHVSTYFKAAA